MFIDNSGDRRQHERYDTDLKIAFSVNFELETKIKFRIKKGSKSRAQTYTAVGHNVNVEGLGFSSDVKLNKGEFLAMDVFLPNIKIPIRMDGRVIWCTEEKSKNEYDGKYRTGVRVIKVGGEDVQKSLVYDPEHRIRWSIVMESVFGGFKKDIVKKKEKNDKS